MRARTLYGAGALAVAAMLLSACIVVRGSGNLVTEERSVHDFDRVDLSTTGHVVITQGTEASLTVETDENVLRHISTEVRGRTLYLDRLDRPVTIIAPTRLRFTLQVTDLAGLAVSGSGTMDAGRLNTADLDIDLSGSGNVQIDELRADTLNAYISGSGNVVAAGDAARTVIDISGSGAVEAGDLRSDAVRIEVSGSGAATVWAVEQLEADLSGSGAVRYYGNPQVESSTSGSGRINSLGAK